VSYDNGKLSIVGTPSNLGQV